MAFEIATDVVDEWTLTFIEFIASVFTLIGGLVHWLILNGNDCISLASLLMDFLYTLFTSSVMETRFVELLMARVVNSNSEHMLVGLTFCKTIIGLWFVRRYFRGLWSLISFPFKLVRYWRAVSRARYSEGDYTVPDSQGLKVFNKDGEQVAYIEEKAMTGSLVIPCDRVSFLVRIRDSAGFHLGYGFREGDSIYTATHVVTSSFMICNAYDSKRSVPTSVFTIKRKADVSKLTPKTPGAFSLLGVKSCRLGNPRRNGQVKIPLVKDIIGEVKTMAASGVTIDKLDNHPFGFSHTCSTYPGLSGSPIMYGSQVVGIHIGALVEQDINLGVDIKKLVVKHVEETVSNLDDYIYDQDTFYTNRKGKYRNVVKVHDPNSGEWEEISEYSDHDYAFEPEVESDKVFRKSSTEVGATKTCVSTSCPVSLGNGKESTTDTKNQSTSSGIAISDVNQLRKEDLMTQSLMESLRSSLKQEITSILQSHQIGRELNTPSPTVVEQSQNTVQTEVSKKRKRTRKRKTKSPSLNGVKTTLSQTVHTQETVSEQPCPHTLQKLRENQHPEPSVVFSATPIDKSS
jgi:hypothetical protein